MTSTDPTAATASRLVRYSKLLKATQKTLDEGKRTFDVEKAIKDCYGEDADMFREDELAHAIDAMIDEANGKIKKRMHQTYDEQRVEETLERVETIIHRLDAEDARRGEAEEQDRDTAKAALEDVRLPADVTPRDVMKYHAYRRMQQERDVLLAELEALEDETKQLEEQTRSSAQRMQQTAEAMQEVGKELETTANACSMAS